MRFKHVSVVLLFIFSRTLHASSCEYDPNYTYAINLRKQQYDLEAVAVLNEVIRKDPACTAARLDLAVAYFSLQDYAQAQTLFVELRNQAETIPDLQQRTQVLTTIDDHLSRIGQLQTLDTPQQINLTPAYKDEHAQKPKQSLQLAVGVGVSDNINNGLTSNTFTFDEGSLSGSIWTVKESMRAHSGTWHDVDVAWERSLPPVRNINTQAQIKASWRDNHADNEFDMGTLQARLDVKPEGQGQWQEKFEPSVVVSGGTFLLGGEYYRQDIAVGGQIQPTLGKRKLAMGYQFTDSHYQTIEDTDSRFHKVNINLPLLSTPRKNMDAGLYVGYQWPQTADKFADYTESSARIRLDVRPKENYQVSASYGVVKQQDKDAYNPDLFGNKKRNLRQRIADIGWAWAAGGNNKLTYEAKIQAREHNSGIQLFDSTAIDVTAGVSIRLD